MVSLQTVQLLTADCALSARDVRTAVPRERTIIAVKPTSRDQRKGDRLTIYSSSPTPISDAVADPRPDYPGRNSRLA